MNGQASGGKRWAEVLYLGEWLAIAAGVILIYSWHAPTIWKAIVAAAGSAIIVFVGTAMQHCRTQNDDATPLWKLSVVIVVISILTIPLFWCLFRYL